MDFNKLVKIGETFTNTYTVKESDTADSYGNKGVFVLSTPALLTYIEAASSIEVIRRLPKGYSPVGVYVELNHLSATPVNASIDIISKVIKVENKRFTYEFKVFYNDKLISKGTYGQGIVLLDEFLRKNKAI